ncbi:MAG: isopenicillin N synthase family oxygenase [Alphaproteobacteria bacterium]|nr:isopenicillin N synthase family oxygenase [Alphaproteobacteria bacterium]
MSVPVVDLRDYTSGDPARKQAFVQAVGDAIRDLGFVRVQGHGVVPEIIEPAYAAARAFFRQPEDDKMRYFVPGGGGERGYTPFGFEHAKDQPTPDMKEFWHVGRELDASHPLARVYPRNLWPERVPAFRTAMLEAYRQLEEVSVALLESLALYIGEPADTFTAITTDGNTILRPIHYPPIDEDTYIPGAIRAAAHEDINFITLLMTSTSAGLELLTREGEWMPANAEPGEILADTGDMMSRVTNGFLPATTHRVVNPEDGNTDRLSMPFFVHPRPDAVLRVLDQFRGPDFPPPAADITGYQFLRERLLEIGLIDEETQELDREGAGHAGG